MTGRLWTIAIAGALASLAACTSSKSDTPTNQGAPPPAVRLQAAATSVIADGTKTVALSVTNTGTGSVTVTTDRGLFQGSGSQTASVTGAFGTVTLVTCTPSSPTDASCLGTATVRATGAAGSDSATITFVSLQTACQSNCAADLGCGLSHLACDLGGGATGMCSNTSPSACVAGVACTKSPANATTETSCSDGVDNDCNGYIDCQDGACDGQPCLAGSPTFVCKSKVCTDITSGLGVAVLPARNRLPANGTAQTAVEVDVTSNGDPLNAITVTVSTSLAGSTITPAAAMTGADGKAHFTFTSSASAGVATITAQLQAVPTVHGTALVTMPRLGSLNLVTGGTGSVEFPVMGAIGSGWQEFGWVQVMAIDEVGLPYPDGLDIRFQHQRLGGSTLIDPLAADTTTCVQASGCVAHVSQIASGADAPDTTGLASTWIYSGRVAGTLAVTATATGGGTTRTIQLPTIAVVGAKASGSNFSIVCSPRNVPALAETDCSTSSVDAPFTCEAILKDRFDNVLGRSTQVIFLSEAGAVGQPTWTSDYDPTKTGDQQMNLGIAVQAINTLGAGLPFDVDPLTTLGEPSLVHGLDGCGLRTHNPRDGVVTVIAYADGEEAFFDANGNGRYDPGEPFVDQGEPFVDANDNGVWDPGEPFVDVNGNNQYDGPNGQWDANAKIWTQTFVVYTAAGAVMVDGSGNLLGTRIADLGSFVDACTATSVATDFDVLFETTTHAATSETYVVVASDYNFNFLQTNAGYSVDTIPKDLDVKVAYNGLPKYADLVGMGWRYWPCDQNGSCASQCRATGAAAPCLMAPQFTGFSCGLTSTMMITGGSKAAAGTVRWNVDVPWQRYGTGTDLTTRAGVSGTSH